MIHQVFFTWRSRLATSPDTPMCIVIHGGQFTGGVHPPNRSSLRLLVLCLVRPNLCVIHYCLCFQRSHFFHWLPRQMPHQHFQRFDCHRNRIENTGRGFVTGVDLIVFIETGFVINVLGYCFLSVII